MTTLKDLQNYSKYINFIETKYLNKFFDIQKPYIHCKKGCAACCQTGEYPVSELELMYMIAGFKKLPEELQAQIIAKTDKIKAERIPDNKEKYLYECPFLIDNVCSIYNNRAIICRTHGLLFYTTDKNGKTRKKIPDCVSKGLNYSEVFDPHSNIISPEMWSKSKIPIKPEAYNISREVIIRNAKTLKFNIDFGQSKALIDWF